MVMAVVWIFVAIMALLFMITIHELGHYIAAKILGFRVNEFAIGFGKAIYKHTNKKTGEVFSIRMIPLGGYCAFEGQEDPIVGQKKRDESMYTKKGGDYNDMAPWKRIVVLASGVLFNFICAIVFCLILVMGVGYNHEVKIDRVDENTHMSTTFNVGDRIVAVNGEKMTLLKNYNTLVAPIGRGAENTFTMDIWRKSTGEVEKNVPVYKGEVTPLDGKTPPYYTLGFGGKIDYIQMDFIPACGKSVVLSFEFAKMILEFLGKMVTGQISFSEMGGTFSTIAVMGEAISAHDGQPWYSGLLNLLILIPFISVNLAVFNILPIPALDGARIVFVAIEWVRGRPVNRDLEERIHLIGLLCLLGFVLLLDFNYLILQRLM